MRAIVLLNEDGTICKKLHFNSIPDNYEPPFGTKISIRSQHDYFYRSNIFGKIKSIPNEAHFLYGDSDAVVEVIDRDSVGNMDSKNSKPFDVVRLTVQGYFPKNVNDLYFYLTSLIQSGSKTWGVINNLGSSFFVDKPAFWKKLFKHNKY